MPTSALSTARRELAAALTAAGVRGVAAVPPATVTPPAVVVAPDDPYLDPETIGRDTLGVTVRLRVLIAVAHHDTAGALDQLDELVEAVWRALPPGLVVGPTPRPQLDQVGPTELLTTTVPLSMPVNL